MKIAKESYPGLFALAIFNLGIVVTAGYWASTKDSIGYEMSPLEPITLLLAIDGFLLAPLWFNRRASRVAREGELLRRHLCNFRLCLDRLGECARAGNPSLSGAATSRDVLAWLREGNNALTAFTELSRRLDRSDIVSEASALSAAFRNYKSSITSGTFPFSALSPAERTKELRWRLDLLLKTDAIEVRCL